MNLSLALLVLAMVAVPAVAQEAAACETAPAEVTGSTSETDEELSRDGALSSEQLEQVVDFMVRRILEDGSPAFTQEEILEATGVVIIGADTPLLQSEVFLALEDQGIDAFAGSRCSDYGACSLYGDLSGATGEILAMYESEKQEDGAVYESKQLPAFMAHRLDGTEVSSTTLYGKPTILAFLAVHCRHSLDSLPILNRLAEESGDRELQVVGVYINSGSYEDVADWLPELEPKFDVWVRNDDALGDLFSGHLVPAYFFVTPDSQITKKLVGFKSEADVLVEVDRQAALTGAGAAGGQ